MRFCYFRRELWFDHIAFVAHEFACSLVRSDCWDYRIYTSNQPLVLWVWLAMFDFYRSFVSQCQGSSRSTLTKDHIHLQPIVCKLVTTGFISVTGVTTSSQPTDTHNLEIWSDLSSLQFYIWKSTVIHKVEMTNRQDIVTTGVGRVRVPICKMMIAAVQNIFCAWLTT